MSLSMYFIPRTGNLHIGFYHRITEFQDGKNLMDYPVQPSLAKAQLDKMTQHFVQMNLKSVQQ